MSHAEAVIRNKAKQPTVDARNKVYSMYLMLDLFIDQISHSDKYENNQKSNIDYFIVGEL